jgi:hypothetical protein
MEKLVIIAYKIKEFKFCIFQMTLIQKSRGTAESTSFEMPGMEVNKKYPILFADTNSRSTFGFLVTLILGLIGDNIAVCLLPSAYSQAFTDQDIADINSKKEKYQLIYRKKQNSNHFYFEIIK